VAERAIELSTQPMLKPLIDIPKMGELAQKMVHEALDAFVKRDANMARALWKDEEQADRYRDLIHDELLGIMNKDPLAASRAIPLILISRHLERISDHATNIAEDVIYMAEGTVVKHLPKEISKYST
jgi:phosphate transport system protein